MPRPGQTEIEFDQTWFDNLLMSEGVDRLSREAAERTLAAAIASAPVDTHDYRNALKIQVVQADYRRVYRVVGTDWKTMLIEAITGNLARAVKSAARS